MLILVLTAISYGESIVDRPRLSTPPVPIAISSSQSSLLSITPVQCTETANFINVKVWVCYSFLKHNIFSMEAIESFVVVWFIEDPSWKPATCFLDLTLKNSLKRSVLKTGNAFLRLDFTKFIEDIRLENRQRVSSTRFLKTLSLLPWTQRQCNGMGGSSESLVLLLFTRFSRDCMEISLYGSSEVYRSRPDVLGRSACGPAQTFSDTAPGKGLTATQVTETTTIKAR